LARGLAGNNAGSRAYRRARHAITPTQPPALRNHKFLAHLRPIAPCEGRGSRGENAVSGLQRTGRPCRCDIDTTCYARGSQVYLSGSQATSETAATGPLRATAALGDHGNTCTTREVSDGPGFSKGFWVPCAGNRHEWTSFRVTCVAI